MLPCGFKRCRKIYPSDRAHFTYFNKKKQTPGKGGRPQPGEYFKS